MPLSDRDLARILQAHTATSVRLRATVVAQLEQTWRRTGGLTDADRDRFVAAAVPVVQAGQRQMAALTDAQLTYLIANQLDEPIEPAGVAAAVTIARGVDPAEVYSRPVITARTAKKPGVSRAEALVAGGKRLQYLVTTDLQLARTHQAVATMGPQGSRVAGYRRELRGAENCPMCIVASTQRYRRGDLMPIHPGCVVEGTRVSASGIQALTRRWWSGEVVTIRGASGDEFTVTPQHPVLTDKGWIPAHLVDESHHLVRSGVRHRAVGGGPDEHDHPPRVEDLWRAATMSLGLVRMPLAAEDFHGDGTDGEVDVVPTHGLLPDVGDAPVVQPPGERGLVSRQFGRVGLTASSDLAPLFVGHLAAAGGLVGGRSLSGPFLGGHPGRAHQPGLRHSAPIDTVLAEDPPDHGPGYVETLRDGVLGLALPVRVDDVDLGQVGEVVRGGLGLDAATSEFSPQRAGSYASLGRRLLDRLSGQVQLDRVVSNIVRNYSGHVYNLQTDGGWYLSDSHIVANCDCAVLPIVGDRDPGRVINRERYEQAKRDGVIDDITRSRDKGTSRLASQSDNARRRGDDARRQLATETDPARRRRLEARVESWDQRALEVDERIADRSVAVREHGEIGPVLTVRDHKFTSAADL